MYLKKSDMNMLVEYLSIGAAKGDNRSAISPGKEERVGEEGLLNKGLYRKALPRGSTTC